ncbi:MAG TPA: hypothetical protein VK013_08910 [Myxococcaceae bacterium]|nr:hypothetical protein [Myxococcaceae bacterium]
MVKNWKWALALVAVLGVPSMASAHELVCEKRANGEQVSEVQLYPAEVLYGVRITNVHPWETSVALTAQDLLYLAFTVAPPPIAIPLGEYVEDEFLTSFDTYQSCLQMAASDGLVDNHIDNVFRVTWELGETQCTSRVTCCPPPINGTGTDGCGPPPCEGPDCPCEGPNCPPPEGEATRTMGFFKTHETALQACVDLGDIDLGYVTVTSLETALGMLWGSVPTFEGGTSRNQLERQRFLLARQLMVAECNVRLFGAASPGIVDLINEARTELSGTDCSDIADLVGPVDTYNNSGDDEPFPPGFVPGAATPSHAESIADDPTSPGGVNCGDAAP